MSIQTEWRDLGVPVLYSHYPERLEPDELAAHSDLLFTMMETGPGPFLRLMDMRDLQFRQDHFDGLNAALRHPAARHPARRGLLIVARADTSLTAQIAAMIQARVPGTELFTSLAEAEAYIRREGPGLIART